MPELPEVETIKRGLEKCIVGKKISRVHILCEKSFRGNPKLITGQTVEDISRRGKAMLIRLSNNLTIMVHLRMTGQMIYDGDERFAAGHPDNSFREEMPGRFTRIYVDFDGGGALYFNDQRKFGFWSVMDDLALATDKFLNSLGPEPWVMKKEDFWAMLQRHQKSPVKAVLLDQHNIAGVGNIYADEACFGAKILPWRKCGNIDRKEADALLDALCKVMQASIDSGGSTMKDYVRPDGSRGNYLEKFASVFRREGCECPRCGGEILKTRTAGRGTHYCAGCQR